MSNIKSLDQRITRVLTSITNHVHPVERELPKRIYDNGVLIYETPLERAFPGAIYKEYLSNLDDDGAEP